MQKIRYGVVGLGHRGRAMVGWPKGVADFVEPVAVCDLESRLWYEKQGLYGGGYADPLVEKYPEVVFYDDYDKMLDNANLDVVIVETGADIHAEFCAKALAKNINVLSDIPNVANLKEAELLWNAAQNSKAILSTGANPNYQRFAIFLQEFYLKGLLGKPYVMEAEYIHWSLPGSHEEKVLTNSSNWRSLLSPIRYCTHSLGPLLTILDEDLRLVSCFGTGQHGDNYSNGTTTDDMVCAQFRTDSGVIVRLMRNKRCRAKIGHHNYRVFGTEGYMERIDRMDKPVIRYNSMKEFDTELKEVDGQFGAPSSPFLNSGGHGGIDNDMLVDFFTAVRDGRPAPIDIRKGLQMTLPGIYAEESAKRGGEVMRMYYPWDKEWKTEI